MQSLLYVHAPTWRRVEPEGSLCAFADQAVRLRLLCPSFQRGAQEEVPRGHTVLDGTRGHLQTTVWDRGEDDTHIINIALQQELQRLPISCADFSSSNECFRVCPGGYLVFRHHGDRDGGRRAPLLQRTPSAGHEEDTGQPAPEAKRVAQGNAKAIFAMTYCRGMKRVETKVFYLLCIFKQTFNDSFSLWLYTEGQVSSTWFNNNDCSHAVML